MTGFIYAVGAEDGLVKIGFTTKPSARLSHLRANNARRLLALGLVKAFHTQEAELHSLLAPDRVRGEWFRRGRLTEHFLSLLQPWPPFKRRTTETVRVIPFRRVNRELLSEIDQYLAEAGISEFRFGFLAARNGRLVERLRSGGRVWPETEQKVRTFMAERRRSNGQGQAA